MKIPLSWLREQISLEHSPEELSKILTAAGLEVEAVEKFESPEDWVLTIALTPNLGHCASVVGIARELAALTGVPHRKQNSAFQSEAASQSHCGVFVRVQDAEKCPRYVCRLIQGVKVAASPDWLKRRLELSGIRSVNNVVDATNYIMLEIGHPLHAFDVDKIAGSELVVRCSQPGETLVTLDGKKRELPTEILLICDQQRPLAVAGVMGGLDSEVDTRTVNILLESAYFNPRAVRRASKALQLQTEASRRFERGTDPNGLVEALDRATTLICELTQGVSEIEPLAKSSNLASKASFATPSVVNDIHTETFPERMVDCRASRVNAILGQHLAVSEIEAVFKRLNFSYQWDRQDTFRISVPTYRNDILSEIDLIEEVARIYGYDNIQKQQGLYQSSRLPHAPIFLFERDTRSRLIAAGLQEFLTCDLIGPTLLQAVQGCCTLDDRMVQVMNPTSIEQSILRRSLLPGLLQVVKFNLDHKTKDISAFEIGRIHFRSEQFFKEESMAAIVLTGRQRPNHWEIKPVEVDFYELKGLFEGLIEGLGFRTPAFRPSAMTCLHPGRQAGVFIGDVEIGVIGEIHPDILHRFDIDQRVFFGEINLHVLYKAEKPEIRMEDLPLYPASERDWTITLSDEISFSNLCESFGEKLSPLLEGIELIDVYRGPNCEPGYQNLTVRFTYRDRSRTLYQEEVEGEHRRLKERVCAALGGAVKS